MFDTMNTDWVGVWSPIETAPMDGTWILIHCEGIQEEYSPFLVARWSGAEWSGWETLDAQHYCATSWMALPEPPKPKTPTNQANSQT